MATVHVKYGRKPLGSDCILSKRSRGALVGGICSRKKRIENNEIGNNLHN